MASLKRFKRKPIKKADKLFAKAGIKRNPKIRLKGKGKSNKRSAIQKLRDEQKAETQRLEKLFKDFRDPMKTQAGLQRELGRIGEIDTSPLTGTAGADVERLRQIATAAGPTEAAKALLSEQELAQKTRLEDIEQAGAQRAQSAFESLAGRGGAGAGARERLAAQTGREALLEGQRERRAGAQERLGILREDVGRKLGLATQLPGQQLSVAQGTLAGQQARSAQDLAKAQLGQQASQFDVLTQQRAREFGTTGQAGAIQLGSQQASEFGAAQLLAQAQREAAGRPTTLQSLTAKPTFGELKGVAPAVGAALPGAVASGAGMAVAPLAVGALAADRLTGGKVRGTTSKLTGGLF